MYLGPNDASGIVWALFPLRVPAGLKTYLLTTTDALMASVVVIVGGESGEQLWEGSQKCNIDVTLTSGSRTPVSGGIKRKNIRNVCTIARTHVLGRIKINKK